MPHRCVVFSCVFSQFWYIETNDPIYLFIYLLFRMKQIITALQVLLTEAKNIPGSPLSFVKTIYFWDPQLIPASNLPAITIMPSDTAFNKRWSRYDQKDRDIEIRLVLNEKELYEDNVADKTKVLAIEKLVEAMEGEDTNHQTKENTVCGVIQKNCRLEYTDNWEQLFAAEESNVSSIDYWPGTRSFKTYEATATISVIVVGDR